MTDITSHAQTLQAYKETLEAIKLFEERRDYLRNLLIEALQGDDTAVLDDREVFTYRVRESRRIDTKALKEALPDIAQRFTVTSTSASLRLIEEESVEQ